MRYQKLEIWKKGIELYVACEAVAAERCARRNFSLGDQIRKSALSIPSNIAEGQEGGSDRIYHRHIRIAIGSAAELQTQLLCAQRLGYVSQEDYLNIEELVGDVVKPMYKLRGYLRREIMASSINGKR